MVVNMISSKLLRCPSFYFCRKILLSFYYTVGNWRSIKERNQFMLRLKKLRGNIQITLICWTLKILNWSKYYFGHYLKWKSERNHHFRKYFYKASYSIIHSFVSNCLFTMCFWLILLKRVTFWNMFIYTESVV